MRVLDARESRETDLWASQELGVPSLLLMENAAIGAADALVEAFPKAERVLIVCGPGNNGGDGLALGRQLAVRGLSPRILLVFGSRRPQGDAALQLDIVQRLGLPVEELPEDCSLQPLRAAAERCDLVVDALFGTGLSRPLDGRFADVVAVLDALAVPKLALDLPSGLDASLASVPGPSLRAAVTVTFGAPKIAHVFPPARERCGEIVVADLGVPLPAPSGPALFLLGEEDVAGYVTARDPSAHKGTFGHLLVVAGGPGRAGAAVLAARAALRTGAGLVTVATASEIAGIVHQGLWEGMCVSLPTRPAGGWAADAAQRWLDAASGKAAVAIGPGLGLEESTLEGVRRGLAGLDLPAVLDADGLGAFAGNARGLRQRPAPTLLTPHPGEAARLLASTVEAIAQDRIGAARRAASETAAIVILKGHQSLVATPEGDVFVNSSGNPGMATAGSGDVLTGILGALLARGFEPLAAAQLGVYLHGLAGDLAAARVGPSGLLAGEIADAIPPAWKRLLDRE
jgi:NAD(P)H-hydrate epimerase